MQEIRRFRPSTVSRRFSVAAGFYRTCVVDGILEHSPAEHVRRSAVPAESPTLGFSHLQFEALLTAARESPNPYDFALVAMPACWACGSSRPPERTSPAVGRAIDRAIGSRTRGPVLLNSRGARMDRHAATRRLRQLAQQASVTITRPHPHMLRHTFVTTMLDAGVDLRDVQIAARHADPRTTRSGPHESRPSPQLHPRCLHGFRHPISAPGVVIAADAYSIRCMARLYEVEIEPEVRSWLAGLPDRDFGRVDFLVGLLAEHAEDLGEP